MYRHRRAACQSTSWTITHLSDSASLCVLLERSHELVVHAFLDIHLRVSEMILREHSLY
jgi:hypothetical protein